MSFLEWSSLVKCDKLWSVFSELHLKKICENLKNTTRFSMTTFGRKCTDSVIVFFEVWRNISSTLQIVAWKKLAWHKKIIFRISTIVELIKDYFLVIISTLMFRSVWLVLWSCLQETEGAEDVTPAITDTLNTCWYKSELESSKISFEITNHKK